MHSKIFFPGILIILLLFFGSCMAQHKSKIKKVVLYNTMMYDFKGTDYSIVDSNKEIKKKELTDELSIKAVNSFQRIDDSNYIWKGYIIGKVFFDDGNIYWIKISRYGAFYRDISSNSYYKIIDNENRKIWDDLIENFLTEN